MNFSIRKFLLTAILGAFTIVAPIATSIAKGANDRVADCSETEFYTPTNSLALHVTSKLSIVCYAEPNGAPPKISYMIKSAYLVNRPNDEHPFGRRGKVARQTKWHNLAHLKISPYIFSTHFNLTCKAMSTSKDWEWQARGKVAFKIMSPDAEPATGVTGLLVSRIQEFKLR